ncbi:MAG: aminotransferase class IV [Actinomycetes bacterium]
MTAARPVVWLNDRIVDPDAASVHWSDHGLTVGDGVFETLKVVDGTPFALRRHLDRLRHSASGLGVTPPGDDQLRAAVDAVAQLLEAPLARLRITVTGGPGPMGSSRGSDGPTLLVTAQPIPQPDGGPTAVITVPFTRNPTSAVAGLKTTSYAENVVALARAEAASASEALLANTRGELCEGTGSNVFVGVGGQLLTPGLDSGCLAGITRELVLEALAAAGTEVVVTTLQFGVLQEADEVFLTSSTRDVQSVRSVDGVALPSYPGPLTVLAARVFAATYEHRVDP